MASEKGGFNQEEAEKQILGMIPKRKQKEILEEFKNIFNKEIKGGFEKFIENGMKSPEGLAVTLKVLCNEFSRRLNVLKNQSSRLKNKKRYTENLYSLGLKIIYNFRNLFFQENFVLRYTLETQNNKGETKEVIVEIDYNELINNKENLKFSISEGKIHFMDQKLKELIKDELDNSSVMSTAQKFFDLWNEILKYGGTEDNSFSQFYSLGLPVYYKKYNKKKRDYVYHPLYKHMNDSKKIYRIDNNNYSYYYTQTPNSGMKVERERNEAKFVLEKGDGSTLNYFNRGFLFEWYDKYLIEEINHQKEDTSDKYREKFFEKNQNVNALSLLEKLLKENATDTIEGYKAGDYFDENLRIMYQAKYYNSNSLITFTGIEDGIENIQSSINDYFKAIKELKKDPNLIENLKQQGNKFFNNLFDFWTPNNLSDFGDYLTNDKDEVILRQEISI